MGTKLKVNGTTSEKEYHSPKLQREPFKQNLDELV